MSLYYGMGSWCLIHPFLMFSSIFFLSMFPAYFSHSPKVPAQFLVSESFPSKCSGPISPVEVLAPCASRPTGSQLFNSYEEGHTTYQKCPQTIMVDTLPGTPRTMLPLMHVLYVFAMHFLHACMPPCLSPSLIDGAH